MENKRAHLEMIQGVISRMANNSFLFKGWAVTLVLGVLALFDKENKVLLIIVACIPIVLFWVIDSFYLQQERLFRSLYDKVRLENETDFSMKATKEVFPDKNNSYFRCLFSKTEVWFYFLLSLSVIGTVCIASMRV